MEQMNEWRYSGRKAWKNDKGCSKVQEIPGCGSQWSLTWWSIDVDDLILKIIYFHIDAINDFLWRSYSILRFNLFKSRVNCCLSHILMYMQPFLLHYSLLQHSVTDCLGLHFCIEGTIVKTEMMFVSDVKTFGQSWKRDYYRNACWNNQSFSSCYWRKKQLNLEGI